MTDTSKEAAWDALMNYQQADEEGIMVLVSRQAIHECKDERDALRAQLQAARECLQATVRKANGDVEPVPAFHHPQVNDTSALKSTSAEGEG